MEVSRTTTKTTTNTRARTKKSPSLKKSASKAYFQMKDTSIYKKDFLKSNDIPKSSVDLIVTSPPYNVDIHYGSNKDDLSYLDYLDFTKSWVKKCYDLAKDDGRFCLNIPLDKNKGGQQSICS